MLPAMTRNRKLAGYIRVSRVAGRKGDSFASPDLQRKTIEGWAKHHPEVEIVWFEPELDRTGRSMARPVFSQILSQIRSGELDGIIVAKLNRFARTLTGALTTVQELEQYQATLVSVEPQIDLSSPEGRAFMRVLMVFAELEVERIKLTHAESVQRAIAEGKKVGATKFGYDRVGGRMVPNDDAPTVLEAFKLAACAVEQDRNLGCVRSYLEQAAPDRYWGTTQVRSLLTCRTYLGEVSWGAETNRTAHEAIVPRELFEGAQRTARVHRRGSDYPLSGLASCATCGAPLVGHMTYTRGYACRNACRKGGTCERPVTIRADVLEGYVREQLLARWQTGITLTKEPAVDMAVALQALEEAEDELKAFASDLTARRLLGAEYHAQLEIRVSARDAAQQAYREQFNGEPEMERVDTRALIRSGSPEDLRGLFAAAFETIAVKPVGRGYRVPPEERITLIEHDHGVATPAEDVPGGALEAAS